MFSGTPCIYLWFVAVSFYGKSSCRINRKAIIKWIIENVMNFLTLVHNLTLSRDQVKEQNGVLNRAKDMEKQVLDLIDRKSILEP